MIGRKILVLASLAVVLSSATSAIAQTSPEGVWIDHTGRGGVEIGRCGDKLCGHIVWLKDNANSKLCGTKIIGNVKAVGRGKWDNGWIFSPEQGEKYDVELTPLKSGKLRVLGYAGVKFLSETMIWKPAPADIQRCDQTRSAAVEPPKSLPPEAKTTAPEARKPLEAAPQADKPEEQSIQRKSEVAPSASPSPIETPAEAEDAPRKSAGNGPFSKHKDNCKLDLPYISLSFPCPD